MLIRLFVVTAGGGSSSGRSSSSSSGAGSSNSSSGVATAVAAAAASSSSSSSRSSGSVSGSSRSRGRYRSSCSRRGRHRRRQLSSSSLLIVVVEAEAAVTKQHLMHIACPCCRHAQEPSAIAAPQRGQLVSSPRCAGQVLRPWIARSNARRKSHATSTRGIHTPRITSHQLAARL